MDSIVRGLIRLYDRFVAKVVCKRFEVILAVRDFLTWTWATINGRMLVITDLGALGGDRTALLVTSSRGKLPESIETLIRLLEAQGCAVVLVINGKLGKEAVAGLPKNVVRVLERPNLGRDFGAYQAGARYLNQQGVVPKRLLLANDSVYYDRRRAPDMLRRAFESSADFVAATESYDPAYHVTSFFMVVSDKLQASRNWSEYWRTYKASSSRPHVISKGELGFTAAMMANGGFRPEVLYTVMDIAPKVREWTLQDVVVRLRRLPAEFRADFENGDLSFGGAISILNDHTLNASGHLDISETIDRLQGASARSIRRIRLSTKLDSMLSRMEGRSQIHWGGLLMVEYLNIGIVKKDFVFRGLYGLNEFVQSMSELGYPDISEVISETRARGLAVPVRSRQRVLYDRGYI